MNEEEYKSNLPPLTEPEDVPVFLRGTGWYGVDTSGLYLDFAEPYRPPRWTLSHNGRPFANLGDLHVITGKSGHGKTSLMSMVMATVLSGKCGGLQYELKELVPEPIVLYIDTEMGKDDTIAIKNRVCAMAGLDYTKPQQRFKVARLRDTELAHDRWKQILKLIYEVRPTVCMIDGVLDIVEDYNSQEECGPIIRQCMMAATEYDASIWCVLHENPTFEKMVGTLGSILQRKVTEVFAVRKHNQSNEKQPRADRPEIYFEVAQLKARGRDVEGWDFQVTSDGGWGMPQEIYGSGQPFTPEKKEENDERMMVDEYFKKFDWPRTGATYTDAVEKHLRGLGVTSNRQIKKIYDIGLEAGIIYKNAQGKYFYKGLFGKTPNDTTEQIPFKSEDECPF